MTDDEPDADPVDAELIAYLDGELEPAAARALEDRLDADPKLRARAAGLKRSFDLLDFLPKPEPSPTFATRTMDKLPISGSKPAVSSSSATTMTPAPLSSLSVAGLPVRHRGMPWAWAAGVLVAAGLALGVGYLGTAALRTYVFPPGDVKEPGTGSLSVTDVRMIANLPLYAAVDDFAFLKSLEAFEALTDDLNPPDWLVPKPPLEADKPTDTELQVLFRTFRELPAERQEKIRALDHQVHALEPPKRDRMLRLLETYAAWLQRLPDADRKRILEAAGPGERLAAVEDVLLRHGIAALPAGRRMILKELPTEERVKQQLKWRAEEEKFRTEWAVARVQWESLRTGKQPWPFTDERMKKDVIDYIRAAYHPDEPRRARLSSSGPDGGDAGRLKEALDRADKGEWALLGKAVHDFALKYEMLPEPRTGHPVSEIADLPAGVGKLLEKRPKLSKPIEQAAGKWPEFALAIHGEVGLKPFAGLKGDRLGPCSPDEFRDDFKRGLGELRKKLTDSELATLKALDGTWPNYPREVIRLAKVHDASLPGVLPPGPPSLWEKTYNPPRQPMRPGG